MKNEVETNFESWKWISLRYRRIYVFVPLNLSLCCSWTTLFFSSCHFHCYQEDHHNHKDPNHFIVGGTSLMMFLHSIVALLTMCNSRLQSAIEYNSRLGKGLVHGQIISMFLVFLNFVLHCNSETESGQIETILAGASVSFLLPRLLNNLGYCRGYIALFCVLFCIPWFILIGVQFQLSKFSPSFWIVVVSAVLFNIVDVNIQESEYRFHFNALKRSMHLEERGKNFDFADIISSIGTAVDMISQLEFDIRYRIKRSLDTSGELTSGIARDRGDKDCQNRPKTSELKPGIVKTIEIPVDVVKKRSVKAACKAGWGSLQSHHSGHLYLIETICEAVSISLSKDSKAFEVNENESFHLSEMIENIFWAFEDSFCPRVAPVFFDPTLGDLVIQKTSRNCVEMIVFLILFDSLYGKDPGFCSVSFECVKHGGVGHSKSVQLVITKCGVSSHLTGRNGWTSNAPPDGSASDGKNSSKQSLILGDQSAKLTDAPQIILADRLAAQYLNTRICGSGPHQSGHVSTCTWSMDISSMKVQQCDEVKSPLCDLRDNLCDWKLLHDSRCSASDLHVYQSFKNTLTKLGVTFTMGVVTDYVESRNGKVKHKICVIHDRILNRISDSELDMLISIAANVIILIDADEESTRRDASCFMVSRQFPSRFPVSPNPVSVEQSHRPEKHFPQKFRRLFLLQVCVDVSAADFIKQFNRIHLEPKYAQPTEQPKEENSVLEMKQTCSSLQPEVVSADRELVYLRSGGDTISLASCWYQMMRDWKVHCNGYPRLLQAFQKHYGTDFAENNTQFPSSKSAWPHKTSKIRKLSIHNFQDSEVEQTDAVSHRQSQQKTFELIESNMVKLFNHPCLTLHSIGNIMAHSKELDATKENDNSLLTIVNDSAYGRCGGGVVHNYLVAKFIRPLHKLRALVGILDAARDLFTVTETEEYLINDLIGTLDSLIVQSSDSQDDLTFLSIWFGCIRDLFSDDLTRCRVEVIQVAPMMIDIAEKALWGLSDSCTQNSPASASPLERPTQSGDGDLVL